jgi:hypothetical protein
MCNEKISVTTRVQLGNNSCNPGVTGEISIATHVQLVKSQLQPKCNSKNLNYNPCATKIILVAPHV